MTHYSNIVVAGHICLDIIPTINPFDGGLESFLVPGKLIDIGKAVVSTGGAVSNTGLALHRLGLPVELMGKVGNDPFGQIVLNLLESRGDKLAEGMIVSDSDQTSYSVVISPPDVDRIFLHCPGANDTFRADNIDYETLSKSGMFHFGYPPLMRTMYENDGRELTEIFRRVKKLGITTSLDMALPDPNSPAGKANWPKILADLLPHIDVFLPSLDEIVFMLGDKELQNQPIADGRLLKDISQRLIDMGVAIVVIKLGEAGLYLRTTNDKQRLETMGTSAPKDIAAWTNREFYSPCFKVDVVGTTGAGDCTIAGFLAGLFQSLGPEDALTAAVATGACSVETADATSGVQPWDKMQMRIKSNWNRKAPINAFADLR
ncbi:MAG: carbohydrate kinase family protein [Phycisphaerae bacterium]|nr:carbohydrate kinase family protein [Phycisphaerae bacterium]